MRTFFVFLCICACLFSGCLSPEVKSMSDADFNIPAFIQSEQNKIKNTAGLQIVKTVTLDSISERIWTAH
ncbi:MAG: hypothetical protein ACK4IY_02250 [Chitinophagales bacterium]